MTCVVLRWLIKVSYINSVQAFLPHETCSCIGTDDHCQSSDVFCLHRDRAWALVEISQRCLTSLVVWSWKRCGHGPKKRVGCAACSISAIPGGSSGQARTSEALPRSPETWLRELGGGGRGSRGSALSGLCLEAGLWNCDASQALALGADLCVEV